MTPKNPLICILPRKFGLGGPSSFQSNLVKGLQKRGIEVCFDAQMPGITAILVIGGTRHIQDLRKAQRRGIPVIQRLNGMNWVQRRKWTGVRHFLKAEWGNLVLASIRRMADRVVYQSEFARDWWTREKGRIAVPQTVVHNGVDLEMFSPAIKPLEATDYRLLMVEGHHGGGYDQGLTTGVELLNALQKTLEKPVSLTVVGDVPETLRKFVGAQRSDVHWMGVVDHARIPEVDRAAHLLFSSDVNAACPNSVIEALACGLPVVGFDTGSLAELVNGDAGRVVPYNGDVWRLEKPNSAGLVKAVQEILLDQQRFSRAARETAQARFDLDKMTERYLQVLLEK